MFMYIFEPFFGYAWSRMWVSSLFEDFGLLSYETFIIFLGSIVFFWICVLNTFNIYVFGFEGLGCGF